MKKNFRISSTVSQKQRIRPVLVYAAWTFGIVSILGLAVFTYLQFGKSEKAFAGPTFTSTAGGGNWSTGSTWVGGTAPGNWGDNTAHINGNVTLANPTTALNGYTLITLNNGRSFTSGTPTTSNNLSFQNVTFNVISGNVTIYGNLTLNNTSFTITSGNLTVTGTLTLTGGSTLTYNSSGSINANAISFTGSGGTINLNNGSLGVTTSLAINSSTTINVATAALANTASLSLANNATAILNNAGTMTVNGNVSQGGALNNTGTLQVNGNIVGSGSGSSVITNSKNLTVTGNITLPNSSKLYGNPGGITIVDGNITVSGNLNLVIGTNAAPPPYADLVIRQDLISTGSGDVRFDRNSRVAIFGNVTDSGGGGTLFTINNGGQVYIDGNVTYSGGGSVIANNNTTNPYGFYVNGTVTNSGGGSVTTTNRGNEATMQTTNVPFNAWVTLQSNTPLPVTLISFKVKETTKEYIALSWATASEENFEKFVVERSVDGKYFESITEIIGAGNSKTVNNYSHKDENPLIGSNYYRLKSIDLDGTFEYSGGVIHASFESSKALSIYPNPSKGTSVNFRMNFEPEGNDVVSVIDMYGSEIARENINGNNGEFVFNTSLKPGTYLVKYSSSNFNLTERLVVR